MNPFQIGDKVFAKEKNRRNGTVMHVMCGVCEKCSQKNYSECTAETKNKLLVHYSDGTTNKRFKCEYTEVEAEPPLPFKAESKAYDLSPKEIRPLGSATLSLPLIEDEESDENEIEVDIDVEELTTESEKSTAMPLINALDPKFQTRSEQNKSFPEYNSTIRSHNKLTGMFFDRFLTLEGDMPTRPV
jgi:hypothetical protein